MSVGEGLGSAKDHDGVGVIAPGVSREAYLPGGV